MRGTHIEVKEADKLEIITVIDNYTDITLTESTDVVKRPPLRLSNKALLAEHGLCLLIKVFKDGKSHSILFDAGLTRSAVPSNLNLLKIDMGEVETIVLSHGHFDHFGALEEILKLTPKRIPLVLHPDAFLTTRFLEVPGGQRQSFPILNEERLTRAEVVKTREPSLLVTDLITSTGEVERVTDFEKGFPFFYLEKEGKKEHDPILDDQGVVVNIKNKGIVIISGCAHSGIVNVVSQAQRITGINKVYAILGGFHLTGPIFEPIIGRTIDKLKRFNPSVVVPMHCTGWKAINKIAKEMPGQFVLNTVGARLIL
jgi:7,8-dihydropterin-6-yl-methyl-4-(beta-D-ribofuranosyl)aminobenzene 5'-phosphate synthase